MTAQPEQAVTVDPAREENAEQALLADWQALFDHSLWELWENESDAVYDSL